MTDVTAQRAQIKAEIAQLRARDRELEQQQSEEQRQQIRQYEARIAEVNEDARAMNAHLIEYCRLAAAIDAELRRLGPIARSLALGDCKKAGETTETRGLGLQALQRDNFCRTIA